MRKTLVFEKLFTIMIEPIALILLKRPLPYGDRVHIALYIGEVNKLTTANRPAHRYPVVSTARALTPASIDARTTCCENWQRLI